MRQMMRDRAPKNFIIFLVLLVILALSNITYAKSYFGYDEWGGTWHDANKKLYWLDDNNLCWAAASSNILKWTGWAPFHESSQSILHIYQNHWTDKPGWMKYGWYWWLNGYEPTPEESQSQISESGAGNLWSNYNFWNYFYENTNSSYAMKSIAKYLRLGYGVTIAVYKDNGHALTVWGYEYDENGEYTAIWVTNSDSGVLNQQLLNRDIEIFDKKITKINKKERLPVEFGTDNLWYLGGDFDGWYIGGVQAFERIDGKPISQRFGFKTDPAELEAPTAPTFHPEGELSDNTTYTWTFDDGVNTTIIEEETPIFQILHPGEYTVTMEAHDPILGEIGLIDTIQVDEPHIQVFAPEGTDSLKRTFSRPTTLMAITQYTWNFGDGTTATGSWTKDHTYAARGEYTVTLTLDLDDGSSLTSQKTVTIGPETRYVQAGTISAGTYEAWDGVVVVQGDVTVAEGATLSIEPGTIVKFENDTSILVNGRLLVQGTADNKIVLTSYHDDEYDGDTNGDGNATLPGGINSWDGIELASSSTNSIISHTITRFGSSIQIYASARLSDNLFDDTNVSIRESSAAVTRNTLNDANLIIVDGSPSINQNMLNRGWISIGTTLSGLQASPVVTENTIHSDAYSGSGIRISLHTPSLPQIFHNTISGFEYPVIFTVLNGISGLGENTTEGNTYNAVYLDGCTWLEMDARLKRLNIPYIVSSCGISVEPNVTLTIDPGTILKLEDQGGLYINGTLVARGTSAARIVFTSLHDDEYGGDTNANGSATQAGGSQNHYWNSIHFDESSSSNSIIEYCLLRYGGEALDSAPDINSVISSLAPDITIQYNEIRESRWGGIAISHGSGNATAMATIAGNTIQGSYQADSQGISLESSNPTIQDNNISAFDYGIHCEWAADSAAQVHNNTIQGNLSYAVFNKNLTCLTLNAANNDWGDSSGPLDDSDDRSSGGWYSPEGLGGRVSDGVDYFPYGRSVPIYTVSGYIRIADSLGVPGVTVSGFPQNPVSDENGYYSATVESGWSGTITPIIDDELILEPGSLTYTDITEDQSEQNYQLKFPDSYTISGYIRDSNGKEISEVLLKDLPDNPKTDDDGFYIAAVPSSWSGTVTPQKEGLTFTPTSQTYTGVLNDQQDQDYLSNITVISISGYVYDKDGTGMTDVILNGLPGTPLTDSDGFFSVTVESGWSGTVIPERSNYVFTPENIVYTNVTSEQSEQNYTEASQESLSVYQAGTGAGGITSSPAGIDCGEECVATFLSGSSVTLSVVPDAYSTFVGWSGAECSGTADCVVSMDAAKSVTAEFSHETYTISGVIMDITDPLNPTPVEGVALNGFPDLSSTTSSGSYSASVPSGWSGTIVPQKTGYTFTEQSLSYSDVMTEQPDQNYSAYQKACVAGETSPFISGYVRTTDGEGIEGVVLEGFANNPSTNSDGYYAIAVDSCWNGTVTPQKAGYSFNPPAWTYADVSEDQLERDFLGSPITYEISGFIQDSEGTPLAGVALTGLPGNPTTDASGYYKSSVQAAWSGTVTPQKSGYSFSPADMTYTDIQSEQSDQDYVATGYTYTISGYVRTFEGTGISDVVMDGAPEAVTTDANGYYEIFVDYDWSGSITPQSSGKSFLPVSRRYEHVTADLLDQDYAETPQTLSISGYVLDESDSTGIEGVVLNGFPDDPVTDADGYYTATVDYGWSGTVTPQKTGFTFSVPSRVYGAITASLTEHNYTGASEPRLHCEDAEPLTAGVSYDGDTTTGFSEISTYSCQSDWDESGPEIVHTITTTEEGDLTATISNLSADMDVFILDACNPNSCVAYGNDTATYADAPAGTYYIVVDGYADASGSYTLNVMDASIQRYSISGYVRDSEGVGLSGVWMGGLPENIWTDSTGYYSVDIYEGWTGTVTPSIANYLFEPNRISYDTVSADQTGQDYTGTLLPDDSYEENDWPAAAWDPGYKWEDTWLSTFDGLAYQSDYGDYYKIDVEAETETVLIECQFTHADGDINIGLYDAYGNWLAAASSSDDNELLEYTVSASGTYYIGVFGERRGNTYDLWWDDMTLTSPSISGYITTPEGTGIPGISLEGLPDMPITDEAGYYVASGTLMSGWSGTVTPQKEGYRFTPASRTYSDLDTEQTNQDYTAEEVPEQSLTITLTGAGSGSVTSEPLGIECGDTCTASFSESSLVTLTPAPDSGSIFAGWTGACGEAGGMTCVVTMDAAKSVSAQFDLLAACTQVTLPMYSNVGTDIVETGTDAVQAYVFPDWDTSMVDAQTGATWLWSSNPPTDDEQQNGARRTFRESFSVPVGAENISGTISLAGDDLFEIALNGNILVAAGDTCGGDDKASCFENIYTYTFTPPQAGNLLDITAVNLESTVFNPAGIIYNATVSYDLCPQTLTISKTGTGSGSVTGMNIECGSDCVETYAHGTDIILTATPDEGSMFVQWSGACVGGGACLVTMDDAQNVTAEFAPLNACTRNVITVFSDVGTSIVETGTGGVAASGSSDWNSALVDFPSGTSWLWSSATPTSDEQVNGAQRTFRETFTIPDGAEDIVGAVLVAADDYFSVTLNGEIVIQDQCGGAGLPSCFESPYNVAFTPSNGTNELDMSVSNASSNVFNPAGIIYRADIAYSMCARTLTVAATGGGTGIISGTGIDCGTDCEEGYDYGETVTLTAIPDEGASFVGWSGGGCSGIGPCIVTMDEAKTVTATFYAGPLSRYVAPDGSDDNNACVENESPCQTIQYAIDVANAGDTVVAAEGTYIETISLKAGVSVIGAGAGLSILDADRDCSTIPLEERTQERCDYIGGNGPGSVVTAIGTDIDENVVLSGFTITGGTGRKEDNYSGGGIYIADGASPVIAHNTIIDNFAGKDALSVKGHGAGIYISGGSSVIESNSISENKTQWDASSFVGNGCGVYAKNTDLLRIENNTIEDNYGMGAGQENTSKGGGIYIENANAATIASNRVAQNIVKEDGGGIYITECSDCNVTDNVVDENNAYYGKGGGLYISLSPNLLLNNNILQNNGVPEGFEGGGLYLANSTNAEIRHNVIKENSLSGVGNCKGGGAFISGSPFSSINNEISGNSAYSGSGTGFYIQNSPDSSIEQTTVATNSGNGMGGYPEAIAVTNSLNLNLKNSIVWNALNQDNEPMELSLYGTSSVTVLHSAIQGGEARISNDASSAVTWAEGNLESDPLFVDAASGDYHLLNESLCIGAGTFTLAVDDIEGNSRPAPVGSNPDMGAYENQFAVPQVPEISVKQDTTPIEIDNSYDLGSVEIDSTQTVTFQIENLGELALELSGTDPNYVVISGPAANDFSISQQPVSPIPPQASSSFGIQFSPTEAGTHTATVSIANSDSDENPYEFSISGTGVAAACSSPLAEGLHEEDDVDISFSSGWLQGNGIKYTNGADEEISFCFSGTAFTLYRTLAANRGEMEVCVDGECQTVSNTEASTQSNQPVTIDGLSEETHTVTLSKSADDGSYIDLDAVYIGELDVCGTLLAEGRHEENDPDISFSSGWVQAGEIMYTNGASEEASFCFSGTEFTLYRTLAANRGSMDVCVDGEPCQSVSNTDTITQSNQPVTFDGFPEGQHSVIVTKTDADSSYIDLDAVYIGTPVFTCDAVLADGEHDNTDPDITYSAGWVTSGSLSYTNGDNETAVFCFDDTTVTIYRTMAINRASMEVCVDEDCETVSNFSSTTLSNQPYTREGLSDGEHTVTIQKAEGGSSYIDLDALYIGPLSACSGLLSAGWHEDSAAEITYTGSWGQTSSLTYTNNAANTATFCFTGTGITLYRTLAANRGDMELCVDGGCQTVSNYSASTQSTQPVTVEGLSFGEHTVTIQKSTDDGTYIDLDAVEVSVCNGQLDAGSYEETAAEISYTSDWVAAGSLMYTNDAEGVAGFCFSGTGVTISRTLAANRGSLELCVDGVCETVDGYNASTLANQPYAVSGLEDGAHQGTLRKSADDGTYIDLSAVEIVADPCANPLSTGIYEEDAGGISYTPGWATGSGIRYTNGGTNTASFCFSGTEVTIYRTLAANRGDMELCVDAVCETVSNTSSATLWRQPYTTNGLSSGEHTLTIQKAAADGSYIDLDAVGVGMGETQTVEAVVVIRKAGTGQGAIQAGEQVCGADCEELIFVYGEQEEITVQVSPEEGSVFVGWQTEDGGSIEERFYALPGDTVYAVFDVE